jgi:hypothetical protein
MNYYSLVLKYHNETIDLDSSGPKIYPRANGTTIKNAKGYFRENGINGSIFFGNFVDEAPIFDYFHLYNLTYKKEYDWILLDAYSFIGETTFQGRGFLISKRFKTLLEKFNIGKPYRFYESKLMYEGTKLEYYIFHLAQNEWEEINPNKCCYFVEKDGNRIKIEQTVSNFNELKTVIRDAKTEEKQIFMSLNFKNYSDIFYFPNYGYIISENLKNEMEKEGILDFEYKLIENATFEFENKC